MYIEEIRRAVLATPRERLADISAALWKSHAAGAVGDDDAQALAELIAARKVIPGPQPAARRHVGSRPISSASIARRRRVASGGMMPPQIACRFTISEAAALTVILERVAQDGRCELSVGQIAGRAGTCATIVKNAVREARKLGLIAVEARRVSYDRNRTNVITIVSAELSTWIRLRSRKCEAGGGVIFAPTTRHVDSFSPKLTGRTAWTKWNSRGANRKIWASRSRPREP